MPFVCEPCSKAADSENEFFRILGHTKCVGKGRCDCQHRPSAEKK